MRNGQTHLRVDDIDVELVRKNIKNVNFAVYPPHGRVRVSAPARLGDDAVRRAVESRIGWIRRQQETLRRNARQAPAEMIDGESHYVWGRPYRLVVVEGAASNRVSLAEDTSLILHTRFDADPGDRERALDVWYRMQLEGAIPGLIDCWSPTIGVPVHAWRIRKMSTRWGSCDPAARWICVNLGLAQERPEHLEYVVVHEMVHFLEPSHDRRFERLMDGFMPDWRIRRRALNQAAHRARGHEDAPAGEAVTESPGPPAILPWHPARPVA